MTESATLTAEAAAERSRLMDAALNVMRTNGFQGASVQDILEEAGLSTRAFYRQFRSKDDLLLAMFRTASARDVSAVEKRVAAAASTVEAVEAWLDEMLAIAYDRRRLSRLVIFNVTARKTEGFDEEVAFMREAFIAPLLHTLESGAADGTFPGADPVRDAHAVFDLLWSVAGPQARAERPIDRASAKSHVLRFVWPALAHSLPLREGGRP